MVVKKKGFFIRDRKRGNNEVDVVTGNGLKEKVMKIDYTNEWKIMINLKGVERAWL